jgi:regulation of enolase protein 1 (concanavalin A-like superfamily)
MEWLNEPASWQRTGDVLTVSVDPGTDFWRETGYGYIRDSGHVYGEVLGGDLDVSVRVRCTLGVQYDQAGVMLRADERTWLKTGVEFFEGRPRLSTVLTLGRSSWMVTDLPEGTDDIVLRVSRRGDAVEVRYVLDDGPAELAALAFLPPGREVLAGVMGAAPEGPGFRVTFQDLRITEPDWSAPAGDNVTRWQDDQPGWAGAGTPGWSPAEGEPGWPAPEEGAPEWPATAAEEDGSPWPLPAAAEDGPGWTAPAAGEDEADWPVPAAAEEPGWPAPAAEDAPRPDRVPAGEPAPGEPAAPDPARADATVPDPGRPEPAAERGPRAEEPAGDEPGRPGPPGPEASNRGTWSAAPAPSPADGTPAADRDAAADWERLAAGAQVGPAESWVAQPDADVANEWPGPPLRTAVRNGLLPRDARPGPAAGHSADDAKTDPGLRRPRPAEDAATLPDQPGASTEPVPPGATRESGAAGGATADDATGNNAAGDSTAGDSAAGDSATGSDTAEPGPAEPKPPARESRWGRSKRAAADRPPEPDAADEWISLLTADPAEE